MQNFLSFWASYSITWPRYKRSFVSNNWCLVWAGSAFPQSFGKAWRESLTRAKRASLTLSPVSLSVFSLVADLLFDCSRVLEDAKIRTVLQSRILLTCERRAQVFSEQLGTSLTLATFDPSCSTQQAPKKRISRYQVRQMIVRKM